MSAQNSIPSSNMIEFTGPNYNENGYANARYRRSEETVSFPLNSVKTELIPRRLEVLAENGEWQQHPAVFMNYGSREDEKSGRGYLVIFNRDGVSTLFGCGLAGIPTLGQVLKSAESCGLTAGSRANIKLIVKEESD